MHHTSRNKHKFYRIEYEIIQTDMCTSIPKILTMNIYISNLNFTVDEDKLRSIFEKYGEVNAVRIIIDKETGESMGYGFIEMKHAEEGKKAIQEMNSKEIDGRHVKVNIAKPKKRYYRK